MYEAARYEHTSNGLLFIGFIGLQRKKPYVFLKLTFGIQLEVVKRCLHLFSYRKMCVYV